MLLLVSCHPATTLCPNAAAQAVVSDTVSVFTVFVLFMVLLTCSLFIFSCRTDFNTVPILSSLSVQSSLLTSQPLGSFPYHSRSFLFNFAVTP